MTKAKREYLKNYCSEPLELVENYQQAEADGFKGWCIHHRLEIQPDGTRVSAKELIDQNLYYGRPASELVFMRNGEHTTLHNTGNAYMKWHKHSADTRQKIAEAKRGKHLSSEHRKKLSEAHKGKHLSEETRKKMSESHKGRTFSDETRKKLSEAHKGKPNCTKGNHWYTNGVKNIRAKTCPEGFVPGRLK